MSHSSERPLIVGAGPVGLAAALFLARHGLFTRVVETRGEPSRESRALAINPRTLELLEPTGVTQRMLAIGQPIRGARIERAGRLVAEMTFERLPTRYPFMLALAQATTERLLAEALAEAGGTVERHVTLTECRTTATGAEAVLARADGTHETVHCPWLLAADGSRSTVRQQLGIDFVGSTMAQEWYLADVPLRTDLPVDRANVFFQDDGAFLFLLPVIEGTPATSEAAPLWRIIANRPEPLSYLKRAEPAGPPVWTSHFHIAHRVAATFTSGPVSLAGDAAHIHSPLGARGMNLGIEDAWVFAGLARTGRLAEYDALRRPVDAAVVRRVALLTRLANGASGCARLLRRFVFPLVLTAPFIGARARATLTGLDHTLPAGLDVTVR